MEEPAIDENIFPLGIGKDQSVQLPEVNDIYVDILKWNMRDNIWFSCVCYYSDTYLVVMIFLLPVLI